MTSLGGFYLNPHRSQYEVGASTVTRHEGCGWTSAANGANAATGGKVNLSPDQVHALVPKAEEQNPNTPGWSLADVKKAMTKAGVPFEVRSGQGWATVVQALDVAHLDVVLQGDSDRFSNNTCSGAFDGNHAIAVHPASRLVNGLRQRWIDDPICPTGRWEYEYILRNYAVKFWATVMFGVFTTPVPRVYTPTRYRVVITGPVRLYSKVRGSVIGTVTRASYTVTKTKAVGEWWYRIVVGGRTGQALKPNRYTKFTLIG